MKNPLYMEKGKNLVDSVSSWQKKMMNIYGESSSEIHEVSERKALWSLKEQKDKQMKS